MPGKCRSFVDIVCFEFRIDVVTKCVRGQSTVDRSKNFVSRLFGFCGFDPSPHPDSGFEVTNHHGILLYCIHFAAGNQLDLSLSLFIGLCGPRKDNILAFRTHTEQHHTSHKFCKLLNCTYVLLKMLNETMRTYVYVYRYQVQNMCLRNTKPDDVWNAKCRSRHIAYRFLEQHCPYLMASKLKNISYKFLLF